MAANFSNTYRGVSRPRQTTTVAFIGRSLREGVPQFTNEKRSKTIDSLIETCVTGGRDDRIGHLFFYAQAPKDKTTGPQIGTTGPRDHGTTTHRQPDAAW